MFVFLFSLLVLQCVYALPTEEKEKVELIPSRMTYGRDFDRWFNWVPWGSNDAKKPTPSIKERLMILENRQKVLFDLVRCESYDQVDCSPFRSQAEKVFDTPSKEESGTPPTKIIAVTEQPNKNQEQSTAATTAAPVENSTAGSTAAPVENASTEQPASTTVSTAAPSEVVTAAAAPA